MKVTQTYQKADGWMGVSETKLQKALRIAVRAAVVYRHLNYMDFHFREAAYTRYPVYTQRRVKSKSPHRQEQERRPLYHSGHTRQQVLGTVRFSTKVPKGESIITATANFNVPSYVWYLRKKGRYDPGKELEATNRGEMATMTGEVNKEIQKEIDNQGDVKVHRVRL